MNSDVLIRPSPFGDVTQRRIVISYRSFDTIYRCRLQGSSIPTRCGIKQV